MLANVLMIGSTIFVLVGIILIMTALSTGGRRRAIVARQRDPQRPA